MKRWIIVACVVLSSCELVKIVDVDTGPSRLVVNSLFTSDSSWTVSIAQTVHILDQEYFQTPAQVEIHLQSRPGDVIGFEEVFFQNGSTRYREFQALQTPVAGQTYTIQVSAPGFATVQSTASVPSLVEMTSVSLDSANLIPINYDNGGSIPIEFTFQDPPGRGDYYIPQFNILVERMEPNRSTGQFEKVKYWRAFSMTEGVKMSSLSIEEEVRVISDELFDGQRRTVRLHINKTFYSSNEPKTYPWRFFLTHVGEDYFKYIMSSGLQRETSNNPLAQPVQVFTNIEGGLGIFAGASTSTWSQD
jgi:hypothetical protein